VFVYYYNILDLQLDNGRLDLLNLRGLYM